MIAPARAPVPRAVLAHVPAAVYAVVVTELRAGCPGRRWPTTDQVTERLADDLWGALRTLWPDPEWRRPLVALGRATWLKEAPFRCRPVAVVLEPAAREALAEAHGVVPALSVGRFAGLLLARLYALPLEPVDAAAARAHREAKATDPLCQRAAEARKAGIALHSLSVALPEAGLDALIRRRREPSAPVGPVSSVDPGSLPRPDEVKAWRERLGSRRQVAKLLGFSAGLVDEAERDRRPRTGPRTVAYIEALRRRSAALQEVGS